MKIMDYIKFKVRIMATCMNIWGKKEIDIVNDEYSCYIDYLFQSFLQLSFLFSLKVVVMDHTLFIGILDRFRTDYGVFWRMFLVKVDLYCRDIWNGLNGEMAITWAMNLMQILLIWKICFIGTILTKVQLLFIHCCVHFWYECLSYFR